MELWIYFSTSLSLDIFGLMWTSDWNAQQVHSSLFKKPGGAKLKECIIIETSIRKKNRWWNVAPSYFSIVHYIVQQRISLLCIVMNILVLNLD